MLCDVILIYILLYYPLYKGFFKSWIFFMIIGWGKGHLFYCVLLMNEVIFLIQLQCSKYFLAVTCICKSLFQVFLPQLLVYQLVSFLIRNTRQMKRKHGNQNIQCTCIIPYMQMLVIRR